MKYIDAVIKESIRLYIRVYRLLRENFKLRYISQHAHYKIHDVYNVIIDDNMVSKMYEIFFSNKISVDYSIPPERAKALPYVLH